MIFGSRNLLWWGVAIMAGILMMTEPALARNGVLQETWRGISGGRVADLVDSPRYKQPPDQAYILTQFKTETTADQYGSRFSALLTPPVTGEYVFWVASDDSSELWLSADESPKNARLIAKVAGWTGKNQWDFQPKQQSEPIHLETGRTYFIQAFLKDQGGADHISVAWKFPDVGRQIIGEKYLLLPELSGNMAIKIQETKRMAEEERRMIREVETYWKSGKTIPAETAARFPLPEQLGENDSGINILLDHAHQVQFAMIWGYAGQLRSLGFRVAGSQATLDAVLKPGNIGRVRVPVGDTKPFAWKPLPKFNVIVTYQGNPKSQHYLPEEQTALKQFVEQGGGLIILGAIPSNSEVEQNWSLNELAGGFGAVFTSDRTRVEEQNVSILRLSPDWEVAEKDADGAPVAARRVFGKGRVLVTSHWDFVRLKGDTDAEKKADSKRVEELIKWAATGKEPVGGESRLPTEMAGGGGIYPELETDLGGVVLFYARNQHDNLLNVFRGKLLDTQEQVYKWLPSPRPEQPMYLIASAGSGGGWACNYLPKETGVISGSAEGIVSIFAHELAHTMSGPVNAKGVAAGRSPHHNQGEAHAGWFQGKAIAQYNPEHRSKSNRNCNRILEMEAKKGAKLDFAKEFENKEGREKWGKGTDWTKMWWVWQKLDDRYGTTWYPRWYWVRATRWQDQPDHQESWDEMVENMSIAVGEDLFPFFRKIGTTLSKDRLERIDFCGQTLELPVALIDDTPGGNVCLEPAGDYTKPLMSKRAK